MSSNESYVDYLNDILGIKSLKEFDVNEELTIEWGDGKAEVSN